MKKLFSILVFVFATLSFTVDVDASVVAPIDNIASADIDNSFVVAVNQPSFKLEVMTYKEDVIYPKTRIVYTFLTTKELGRPPNEHNRTKYPNSRNPRDGPTYHPFC